LFLFFSVHATLAMDEGTIPDHVDPQRAHVPIPASQLCQELSEMSVIAAFGKRPFPW
jgi:hypothetical protein